MRKPTTVGERTTRRLGGAVILAIGALVLLRSMAMAQTRSAASVAIVSPRDGEAVFGTRDVKVAVRGARQADIFLDGVWAARAAPPAWSAAVDFGDENRAHRLEAVVEDARGASVSAVLVTGVVATGLEIRVALQQLYVSVERDDAAVDGLSGADFTILDGDQRQELVTFERGDVPLTAALLVDASASMSGGRLRTALDGARAFVRALQPLDEAKLLLFSDGLRAESPFTSSIAVLAVGLGEPAAGGGTALNDALYVALSRLEGRQGRKVVILLSDGVDIESVLTMARVRENARRGGVAIYWLRLQDGAPIASRASLRSPWRGPDEHRRERDELVRLVEESGGRIEDVAGPDAVEPALTRVLQGLRAQYVLGYYPTIAVGSGTWHDVRVEVAGKGRVRTQRGYAEP